MQDVESFLRIAIERAGYAAVVELLGDSVQEMELDENHKGLWLSFKKERIVVRHDSSGFVCFKVDVAKERLALLHEAQKATHFVDFEAPGIAPDSYALEVAVVFPGGEYQTLIKPASYWDHWSYDAQDMHYLSREQLINQGQPSLAVAQEMNRLFDDKTLCSDNPVDCFWLDVLFEAAGIEPTFAVQPIESFVGRDAAGEIYDRLPVRKGHRALQDAQALSKAAADHFK
ncbi:hypothetical protein FQ192_31000 [Pseudomonas sp. ANT_J12]|uniref:Uncharacterized protein n=1 Tax=Pseudomonas prosekii TaxID=1148509 RepID=A0A2U2D031_9PSED|nr:MULTISPECIES: hypothetical protein [Pseudomonas]KAA0982637.1 hypothetical protein FQ192_31000 [Pseudomonas sp. ANT_J12]PWE38604.1 hypothetical protein C9I49_27770 [Pseudomonas prosekii]